MKLILELAAVLLVSSQLAQGVTVKVNTAQAPALRDFGKRVKSTLEEWYPRVVKILKSPTFRPVGTINVFFDPNYDGVAYASGNRIVGSVKYYKQNKDIGSMVHEMAHVIQQYQNCQGWVTEGIADWVRYWHFQPGKKPGKPRQGSSYRDGYGNAAFFLNWMKKNGRPQIIQRINKKCREGTYTDQFFKREYGKTVDQFWNKMMNA